MNMEIHLIIVRNYFSNYQSIKIYQHSNSFDFASLTSFLKVIQKARNLHNLTLNL
jgi:hypothetical protein